MSQHEPPNVIPPAALFVSSLGLGAYLVWVAWGIEQARFVTATGGGRASARAVQRGLGAVAEMLGLWGSIGLALVVVLVTGVWLLVTIKKLRAQRTA